MKKNNKVLFVFDLDSTIIQISGEELAFESLKDQSKKNEIYNLYPRFTWRECCQILLQELKNQNTSLDELKSIIQSNSLNPGMAELFNLLNQNKEKVDLILVTGANVISASWLLEKFGLVKLFKEIISHPAKISDKCLIETESYHKNHECLVCERDMCKKDIVKKFIEAGLNEGQIMTTVQQHRYQVMILFLQG